MHVCLSDQFCTQLRYLFRRINLVKHDFTYTVTVSLYAQLTLRSIITLFFGLLNLSFVSQFATFAKRIAKAQKLALERACSVISLDVSNNST